MEVTKLEEGLRITIPGISDIEVIERQKKLLKEVDTLPEGKKLSKMLGEQTIFNDYNKELFAIINLPDNKEQRKIGEIFSTVIDCFDYGVIIGKRMERKREAQKLERLKKENERLRIALLKVNNFCTKTEAVIR